MPLLFPALQPEELLYSAIARYGDMLGNPGVSPLWRSLYGSGTGAARPEVEICGPLSSLLDRLPPGHGLTADVIISRHTLVPYYTFSRSAEDADRIKKKLSGYKFGRSTPRADVWKLKSPEYLQFCSECVEQDVKGSIGSPYWRRAHQLLGVLVCPEHGIPLFESRVGRHKDAEPRDFVSLLTVVDSGNYSEILVPSEYRERCLKISEDTLWILKRKNVKKENLDERHKSWCLGLGWVHTTSAKTGTINHSRLHKRYVQTYEEGLLRLLSSGDESLHASKGETWLKRLYSQNYRRTFHPLQHILGWQLIGLSAPQFFESPPPPVVVPEVKGIRYLSGPCENPLCPDFDPPVPRAHLEGGNPSEPLIISCSSCGFTYSQKARCTTKQHRRVKKTGQIWDDKLRELLLEDASVEGIFKQLGTSTAFILKRALELGLWKPEWSDSSLQLANVQSRSDTQRRKAVKRNRARWLELRKQYPTAGRSQLGRIGASAYRYLRKHDLEWFEQNSPSPRMAFGRPDPEDWERIDAKVVRDVREVMKNILKDEKPTRITLAEISRRVDGPALEARLRNLPKTKALINEVTETGEEYAVRKSKRSVHKYMELGILPSETDFFISSHLDRRSRHAEVCRKAYNMLRKRLKTIDN